MGEDHLIITIDSSTHTPLVEVGVEAEEGVEAEAEVKGEASTTGDNTLCQKRKGTIQFIRHREPNAVRIDAENTSAKLKRCFKMHSVKRLGSD